MNKVNSRLIFLYRQNKFLDIPLQRLVCNTMIKPFLYYACDAWCLNFNKNFKNCLQAAQNKCIRFCLKLGDRTFIKINQCTLSSIHEFHANNAPGYMNEVFSHAEPNRISTLCSYHKLKLPYHKTNLSLRVLSYISLSLWNKLDKSLKKSVSLSAFKHNLKDYYFRKGNKKE